MENKIKPIGQYTVEEGKNIFIYNVVRGREGKDDKIILGDDFSGRNPRGFKLYSNPQKGEYFLYRKHKVFLSDVNKLI